MESDPPDRDTSRAPAEKAADARRTRGIRFSDSEWEEVKTAAESLDMPAAEFVRERILGIARGESGANTAAVLAALTPLIERTFRYTYMLATHKRDDLTRDGRGEEMEQLVKAARTCRIRFSEADGRCRVVRIWQGPQAMRPSPARYRLRPPPAPA